MSIESHRVRLDLPAERRLAGVVVGTVEHFTQRAGFDETAQRDLLADAAQAFGNSVPASPAAASRIIVTVGGTGDRVEVTLEVDAAGVARRKPADLRAAYPHMDDVELELRGSLARLKLAKFLRPPGSRHRP